MSSIVPQGVAASDFSNALDEFAGVVGKDRVYVDEQPLSSYRDAYSPLADGEFLPSAAVAPEGVEQIKKILKIANAYKIPIWTIGTGRNFAYGGPAPRKSGYVMLDLRRMNRIIEVNEKYGYALVEPGVSYMQLETRKNPVLRCWSIRRRVMPILARAPLVCFRGHSGRFSSFPRIADRLSPCFPGAHGRSAC